MGMTMQMIHPREQDRWNPQDEGNPLRAERRKVFCSTCKRPEVFDEIYCVKCGHIFETRTIYWSERFQEYQVYFQGCIDIALEIDRHYLEAHDEPNSFQKKWLDHWFNWTGNIEYAERRKTGKFIPGDFEYPTPPRPKKPWIDRFLDWWGL